MRSLLLLSLLVSNLTCVAAERPPNIVFLLCDNLGYGDIGCFGSTKHRTPNVDRLAADGMKLTSFYSASGVCTPSRAALMTGCYPKRVGLAWTESDGAVLRPVSPVGLHPDEVTIAELLKDAGYATTCIGKWHLGDQRPFLPTQQGFDSYFGIPYSDDMTPRKGKPWPSLPLMTNDEVTEAPVDRNQLTRRYTEAATRFIRKNKHRPFFLYLPHAMPGSTRQPFASEQFRGKSANGAWGDSVEELDWSTGQIMQTIKECSLDKDTIIVWTSDNGAPRRNPPQGSNAPLGGWGYSIAEGGMRVPCLVRWPGHIAAGSESDSVTTMMDWLPTFAALTYAARAEGTARPAQPNGKIDGKNLLPLLLGELTTSPHEMFLYYYLDQLQAVRSGKWKLHLALDKKRSNLQGRTTSVQARLFNLSTDMAEEHDLAASHTDLVTRLATQARSIDEQLTKEARPVGRFENPEPRRRK